MRPSKLFGPLPIALFAAVISVTMVAGAGAQCTATLTGKVGGAVDFVCLLPGNRAAINVGDRLEIIDISNTTTFATLGTNNIGYRPSRMDSRANYNILAAVEDVPISNTSIIHIYSTATNTPTQTQQIYLPAMGHVYQVMPWYSGHIHIAAQNGYFVYDISNPYVPIYRGNNTFPTIQPSVSIAIGVGTVYVGLPGDSAHNGGIGVIDVGNLASPLLRGYVQSYAGPATGITYNWPYVYSAGAGFNSFDVSNPNNPVNYGNNFYYLYDLRPVGPTESIGSTSFATEGTNLIATSFGLPANPSSVFIPAPGASGVATSTSPNRVYVSSTEGWVRPYAANTSTSFTKLGQTDWTPGDAHNVALASNLTRAYVLNHYNNFCVMDISNPAAPVTVSSGLYLPEGTDEDIVAIGTTTAIVSNGLQKTVNVISVVNAASPQIVKSFTLPDGDWSRVLVARGSTLFVKTFNHLYAYDLSTPASPVYLGVANATGYNLRVATTSGPSVTAFVGDATITAINVANPAAMSVSGTFTAPHGTFRDIAYGTARSYAIFTDGNSHGYLDTLNTTSLGAMSLVHEDSMGYDTYNFIEAALGQLYVMSVSYGGGYLRYDVTLPDQPHLVETAYKPNLSRLLVNNSMLVVAEGNLGLRIYQHTTNFAPYWTTGQPASATVGHNCVFGWYPAVQANPDGTYQWYHNGVAMPGKDVRSLTVSPADNAAAGAYFCRFTNSCGSADTAIAYITICRGDFNCTGGITVQDLFDFLAAYFAHDPSADVNESRAVTIQDLFDFLAAWIAHC